MFDLGFGELLLTAVVALLVLGPERLPRAARVAGLWMRRARASWYSVRAQFERELADDELKRSLQATRKEFDGLRQDLQRPLSLDAPRTTATTGTPIAPGDAAPLDARIRNEGGVAPAPHDGVDVAAADPSADGAAPDTAGLDSPIDKPRSGQ